MPFDGGPTSPRPSGASPARLSLGPRRSILVDALPRPLNAREHALEPVRVEHEFLEAFHRNEGEVLAGVAVEELGKCLGAPQQVPALPQEPIIRYGSALVDRNLENGLVELLLHIGTQHELEETSGIGG